jgi:CDP-2,3-bis-(O-geranylgeranyl)-sn-glycerol synthase
MKVGSKRWQKLVTMADVLWIAETIYMYLPAYIANATPVILGGGEPLDGGKTWSDGEPLFGDHKTINGTFYGLMAGTLIGLLQRQLMKGILLSIGAIGGDILISFVKRRLRLKPGAMFPLMDQIGFIVFAITLASLIEQPTWERVITIIVATIPIHLFTNIFAWLLKLKSTPW